MDKLIKKMSIRLEIIDDSPKFKATYKEIIKNMVYYI